MARRASHLVKVLLSIVDRSCATRLVGRRRPGRQKSHEGGKILDVTQYAEAATISIGGIVGRGHFLARRRLISFRLKQFVGDAHFDIVRLTRKHQERLVLRLPTKTGDCPIIAVSIFTDRDCVTRVDNVEPSPDPIAVAYPCCLVVDDGLIRDLLDQPGTECRCRNPEDDVSSAPSMAGMSLPSNHLCWCA
jgi:hypothetical protein